MAAVVFLNKNSTKMAYEIIIGLRVTDQKGYVTYRELMLPILSSYDGRFIHDFEVSKTLLSLEAGEINRLFMIRFPDKQAMESFFSDAGYIEIRKNHFDKSVAETYSLAALEN